MLSEIDMGNNYFQAGLNYILSCGVEYLILQTEIKEGTDIVYFNNFPAFSNCIS